MKFVLLLAICLICLFVVVSSAKTTKAPKGEGDQTLQATVPPAGAGKKGARKAGQADPPVTDRTLKAAAPTTAPAGKGKARKASAGPPVLTSSAAPPAAAARSGKTDPKKDAKAGRKELKTTTPSTGAEVEDHSLKANEEVVKDSKQPNPTKNIAEQIKKQMKNIPK